MLFLYTDRWFKALLNNEEEKIKEIIKTTTLTSKKLYVTILVYHLKYNIDV